MINPFTHPGHARLAAALGVLAMSGMLAACGSSSPPEAAAQSTAVPTSYTDANGYSCDPGQVTSGYCPDDPAAAASPADTLPAAASPDQTDPDGNTCPSLDQAGYCPGDDPVTMTKQTDKIVFKVWGSGYPSVQYGSDSDTSNPQGGYGPLGDGVALPWSAPMTYDSSALYYAVSAQLEGYGNIRDSVTEVVTTYCSNGHHKTESFPLASGHASGGYAIAQAEYADGDTGNATQAESDAGC